MGWGPDPPELPSGVHAKRKNPVIFFSYRGVGVGAGQPLMTNSPGPLLNLQTRVCRCVVGGRRGTGRQEPKTGQNFCYFAPRTPPGSLLRPFRTQGCPKTNSWLRLIQIELIDSRLLV